MLYVVDGQDGRDSHEVIELFESVLYVDFCLFVAIIQFYFIL